MLDCNPEFQPLLGKFDQHALERHAGAIMGLRPDNVLAYVNPAWHQFAFDNGGEPGISQYWGVGKNPIEAVDRLLRPFYELAFSRCRRTMAPWEHAYECSSPDRFRWFHMRVFPLSRDGALLIVNSLAIERPHDRIRYSPDASTRSDYLDHHGMLAQCLHCRRFRHGSDADRWDWVPDWLREPAGSVADVLCPICMDYYYPAEDDDGHR